MSNTITIVGRLTRDPELRATHGGDSVTNLRIASDGMRKDETLYIDVVCWDKLAESVAEHRSKGDQVIVFGRLVPDAYEKDGKTVHTMRIRANSVEFGARAGNREDVAEPVA